jgi:hypothetical protein
MSEVEYNSQRAIVLGNISQMVKLIIGKSEYISNGKINNWKIIIVFAK